MPMPSARVPKRANEQSALGQLKGKIVSPMVGDLNKWGNKGQRLFVRGKKDMETKPVSLMQQQALFLSPLN
jgi:hypothetical protein